MVSDEMVSSGEPVDAALDGAAPHVLLPVTGGSIGQGLAGGVGRGQVACPDRKVIALEADGSAMYYKRCRRCGRWRASGPMWWW